MEPTTEWWSSFSENTVLWDLDSIHWKSNLWTLMIIPACNFIRIGRKNSALGAGSKPIKLMLHFLWTKILLPRAHTKHLFCICGKTRANAYVEKSQTMIEQDPSRYGKNEIPPMLLEQQPPNNPPQCQNTCFSSSCPPMVTEGHFFHLQHHLLYPFSTRLWWYNMTNLQKGKANTVPLERNKGLQHQDEHNPFVVGLNELLSHIALNRKTKDLLHTLGNWIGKIS